MITPIETILNRITSKPNKRLKCLTTFDHESFQWTMSDLNVDFYGLQGQNIKKWDFRTKKLPPNCYIINQSYPERFPAGIDFDFVLSGNRFYGFQILDPLAKQLKLPHINMLHHLPPLGLKPKESEMCKNMRGDYHVFVGYASKEAWGINEGEVIYYGLDHNQYSGWNGNSSQGIQSVNQIAGRDPFCGWELYKKIASVVPVKLIGDNPGLSEMAKSTEDLIREISNCRFYLNTSLYSNFPMSVAEAMLIGIPVVSTKLYEIPYVIKHGENGFLYNSAEEAIEYSQLLLKDYDLAKKIGEAGQKTARELFNKKNFTEKWDSVIRKTIENYR